MNAGRASAREAHGVGQAVTDLWPVGRNRRALARTNLRRTRVPLTARYIAAQEFARLAGERARTFFSQREALQVEHKGSQNLVSHADRSIEELLATKIAAAFPADAFFGEETSTTMTGPLDRVWVVDPIDGTHNFLRGVRYYCVSIAYVENGRAEIGVIYDPEHDELFHTRRGDGAWRQRAGNDTTLRTSSCSELSRAFVCMGHHDRAPDPRVLALRHALMDAGVATRNMGAGALQLAHVAAGHFDGFIELSLNAWDAMAGLLLVEEAGGYVAPFPGPQGLRTPAPVLGSAMGIGERLAKLVAAW
jgi:myo-inositol-1(or 4)-monophosphatase